MGHQLQVAWTAVETPIEALVSAAIAPPPLPPGVAPGINPANLAALAGLVASEMGIVPGAVPGAVPGQMGAPVVASLPESLDEGVEAAGGVGGLKLTGQVRQGDDVPGCCVLVSTAIHRQLCTACHAMPWCFGRTLIVECHCLSLPMRCPCSRGWR